MPPRPFPALLAAPLSVLALAAAAPARAADDQAPIDTAPAFDPQSSFSASLGASAWSGDFGAPWHTDIGAALLTARYRTGDLRLTASLPWMQIRSQGAVFTGIDGAPLLAAPGVAMTSARREGLGDLTLGAARLVPNLGGAAGLDLDVYGKVKLPTGSSSRGVSTGKTDAAIGAELSRPLGPFVPSVSLRYRSFGDAGTWNLKNGFAASIGGTYIVSEDLAAIVSYDYAQAASALIEDSHEVIFGLSKRLGNSGVRLTGFAGAGLSDGAAATSGGISLTLAR